MPFAKKIETEAGKIGIWEIAETADKLQTEYIFSPTEATEFNKIMAEKRKVEFLATRLILQRLLDNKIEIQYHDSGKPVLVNCNLHISISHSADLVVAMVSNQKNGIDVERIDRNIDRVAKRFLSHEEYSHIQNLDKQQMAKIIYWGAKESIFKCSDYQGINFYKQIIIHPFKVENDGNFTGMLIADDITEHFELWHFKFKNNMVVYCVEDKNEKL